MGHRLWLPAVAIHRLVVVEITPSPHHCFRPALPCAQSVKGSRTEPILSRSSRQRLGHLQSHFDGGWHVCQAAFPELQSAAACRRVERHDCAHEALPRLQSASTMLPTKGLTRVSPANAHLIACGDNVQNSLEKHRRLVTSSRDEFPKSTKNRDALFDCLRSTTARYQFPVNIIHLLEKVLLDPIFILKRMNFFTHFGSSLETRSKVSKKLND